MEVISCYHLPPGMRSIINHLVIISINLVNRYNTPLYQKYCSTPGVTCSPAFFIFQHGLKEFDKGWPEKLHCKNTFKSGQLLLEGFLNFIVTVFKGCYTNISSEGKHSISRNLEKKHHYELQTQWLRRSFEENSR